MQERMELAKIDPAAYRAMFELEKYIRASELDNKLLELIKICASQINNCGFCIDLHVQLAKQYGETEQRIHTLSAWRETPFFTPEERTVLGLTEAVTLISNNHVSDELYAEVSHYFAPKQIAQILMAIATINAWNRIAITTKMIPGKYSVEQLIPSAS